MEKRRFKLQYMFWLEPDKPEHDALIDIIESLKEDRAFAPVVRDGILLEADLREGRVDVLLELHPWIASVIAAGQGNEEIDRLRNEIELLKSVVAYMTTEQPIPPPTGPRPLTAPTDDMPLVMRKVASDGKASASNFINSAFNLVSE